MERATFLVEREASQTWSFRGSKSRNKVSVGEPAEGSLKKFNNFENGFFFLFWKDHYELIIFVKFQQTTSIL